MIGCPEVKHRPNHFGVSRWQITSEEKRAEERLQYAGLYDKARKAAEVHRQVRRHAQSYIKPGIKLIDMCTMLEEKVQQCSRLGVGKGSSCACLCVPRHTLEDSSSPCSWWNYAILWP